jgi:hypothetical protein
VEIAMTISMTKEDLIESASGLTAEILKGWSLDELRVLITQSQYVTDICINELERRGEITFSGGSPVLPYVSEHIVETILTRTN